MLSTAERNEIVKDRIASLERERQAIRKEYWTYCEGIVRQVDSEGHTTTTWSIPVKKQDEIKYKICLCALQVIALEDELRRLYNKKYEEGAQA